MDRISREATDVYAPGLFDMALKHLGF